MDGWVNSLLGRSRLSGRSLRLGDKCGSNLLGGSGLSSGAGLGGSSRVGTANRQLLELTLGTGAASIGVELLAATVTLVNTLVLAADGLCSSAGAADAGCVAKV